MNARIRITRFFYTIFSEVYKRFEGKGPYPRYPVHLRHRRRATVEYHESVAEYILELVDFYKIYIDREPSFEELVNSFSHSETAFCSFIVWKIAQVIEFTDEDCVQRHVAVVTAYVASITMFCIERGCYRFAKAAPRCLVDVFNRGLKNLFFEDGGYIQFLEFCKAELQIANRIPHCSIMCRNCAFPIVAFVMDVTIPQPFDLPNFPDQGPLAIEQLPSSYVLESDGDDPNDPESQRDIPESACKYCKENCAIYLRAFVRQYPTLLWEYL